VVINDYCDFQSNNFTYCKMEDIKTTDDAGDVVVDANVDVKMQKLRGGISRSLCA
jgi:hypothetical protein